MTILQTYTVNMNKQLINTVSQSSSKCAETSELKQIHGHTCIQHSNILSKHVIETNPSKSDKSSDIYLCRLRLKQEREI